MLCFSSGLRTIQMQVEYDKSIYPKMILTEFIYGKDRDLKPEISLQWGSNMNHLNSG